jgi:hypothetical protein
MGLMDDLAGRVLARGAVGYEYDFGCERADGEVAETRCLVWWLVAEVFEDGDFVEDAAGAAEFEEVVGEEVGD